MKRELLILGATALLVATGCKTPADETVETKPTATAEQAVAQKEEPTDQKPATAEPTAAKAPVKILGTPHDQEHTKVSLTAAKAGELTLYRSPGVVSNAVGTLKVAAGDAISFTKSWMFVTAPSVVVAKEGAKLQGAASYEPNTGKTAEGMRDVSVEPGATVQIYKVGAEGTCYVGTGGEYYLSTCPSKKLFEGDTADFAGPTEYEWWVMLQPKSGDAGWLKVDEKVKVDVKSTM